MSNTAPSAIKKQDTIEKESKILWVTTCLKAFAISIVRRALFERKEVIMISLNVNGKIYKADVPADASLLWVLRDHLKLTGTKYGCGIGECGACTVHVNGKAERSCGMTVGEVKGKKNTTIEGLPAEPSGQEGMDQRAGRPVRLLPARDHHAGCRSGVGDADS